MGIHEIKAVEVEEWSRRAAEHMLELRTASGALPLTSAGGFLHKTISRFRVGVPVGSRIFVDDDAWQWLWISTGTKSFRSEGPAIVDVKIDEPTEEWAAVYRSVVGDEEVFFECFQAGNPFIDSMPRRDYSVDMVADLAHLRASKALRSNIHLRQMSDSEVMRFMVAAANEKGKALAEVTPGSSENALKRDAFRSIERILGDGVATPGHLLYTIEDGHEPVGYAWMEIDSGTGRIHSVVTPGRDDLGYREGALGALAEIARLEGMRRIAAAVVSPSHQMVSVLEETGLIPVRRLSYILPEADSAATVELLTPARPSLAEPLRVDRTDQFGSDQELRSSEESKPTDRFDLMQALVQEEPAVAVNRGVRYRVVPSRMAEEARPVRLETASLSGQETPEAAPQPMPISVSAFQSALAHMTKRPEPVCA